MVCSVVRLCNLTSRQLQYLHYNCYSVCKVNDRTFSGGLTSSFHHGYSAIVVVLEMGISACRASKQSLR